MARHRKSSLYARGTAGFDEFIQKKKSHVTLRPCLLAFCFDPTTLFELAAYNETLNVCSHGKLGSFVFPQVLIFPSTSCRETSGLSGKQN